MADEMKTDKGKLKPEETEGVLGEERKVIDLEEIKKEEPRYDRGRRKPFGNREEEVKEWIPKTKLGRDVKAGKIGIDEILEKGLRILEPGIVDHLLRLESDLLNIGQSKGKFGGGKRRAWKQTQKKTQEGNVPSFSCLVVVGDRAGHVGLGLGKAKETLPAREKSMRNAKLNIMKVKRGCGSFDCACSEPHSVPFKVEGKCSSVRLILIPAPKGTGLVIGNECKKILRLAGIRDVYSKVFGQTRSTINFARACIAALKKTNEMRRTQ